jgi:hypothetical protein
MVLTSAQQLLLLLLLASINPSLDRSSCSSFLRLPTRSSMHSHIYNTLSRPVGSAVT